LIFAALVAFVGAASLAAIESGPGALAAGTTATTPPSGEDAFLTECGACHIAFPPGFLPKRSWQAIIDGLANHFDEDASLDEATTKAIRDYLLANAADSRDPHSPVVGGIRPDDAPLRITETPFWRRIHHEVSAEVFARPDIKSAANCLACHGGTGRPRDD
jgi:mono/diheme cytochrome c family protein